MPRAARSSCARPPLLCGLPFGRRRRILAPPKSAQGPRRRLVFSLLAPQWNWATKQPRVLRRGRSARRWDTKPGGSLPSFSGQLGGGGVREKGPLLLRAATQRTQRHDPTALHRPSLGTHTCPLAPAADAHRTDSPPTRAGASVRVERPTPARARPRHDAPPSRWLVGRRPSRRSTVLPSTERGRHSLRLGGGGERLERAHHLAVQRVVRRELRGAPAALRHERRAW